MNSEIESTLRLKPIKLSSLVMDILEWKSLLQLLAGRLIQLGYLAPKYATQGQLTKKADVYSFGVLVLEIVSGRSSSKSCWSEMEKFLLEWTWVLYKEGRLTELVDPTVTGYLEEEVIRYIKVALFCTQEAATRRPSMIQVVEMLSKTLRLNENALTPPGLIHDSTTKGRSLEASSSSSFPIKDVRSTTTTAPFDSTAVTFTDRFQDDATSCRRIRRHKEVLHIGYGYIFM